MAQRHDAYGEGFDRAVALAVADFRAIRRKGSDVPYVTHLFAVASLVGEYGGDEEQMSAAVLHDWLEDVPGAERSTLEERFGARVAGLVAALSDSVGHPKPPWRQRKERYLAHLRVAPAELKLISAADKLHNCLSIRRDFAEVGDSLWGRFTGGRDGTLWYYDAVAIALADEWSHPLSIRLRVEVDALLAEAT